MTSITSIGTATPEHCISQETAADFMLSVLNLSPAESRKIRFLYRSSGIKTRYSVLEDYKKQRGSFSFFPNTEGLEPFPKTSERMNIYKLHSIGLAVKAVEKCLEKEDKSTITHLITVSCTGMTAPGLDIQLINHFGFDKSLNRYCINFMGCYASFNALKLANSIITADTSAKVLIVSVELCSIHFQKKFSQDQVIANAIFGDGAAAVLVEGKSNDKISLSIESFFCDLAPEGQGEMAWEISDHGFDMTLSAYVPKIIEGGIKDLTKKLLNSLKLELSDISCFAVHPGGLKILSAIESALNITREENRYSYEVLEKYGNMSSASVLFVLKKILEDYQKFKSDQKILSFAFGPGLTLESMVLKFNNIDFKIPEGYSESLKKYEYVTN